MTEFFTFMFRVRETAWGMGLFIICVLYAIAEIAKALRGNNDSD